MLTMDSKVTELSGIGVKRAACYEKMHIQTIRDLLIHYPRSYIDFTHPLPVSETVLGDYNVIAGMVQKKLRDAPIRRGLTVFKARATDGETPFHIVFYNNYYAFDALKEGETYYFYGKIQGDMVRREILSPLVLPENTEHLMSPRYALTEGLTNAMIQANIRQALDILDSLPYDYLPGLFLQEYQLCAFPYALENIHFPIDAAALSVAQRRMAFDEMFLLQLGLLLLKGRNKELSGYSMQSQDLSSFLKTLPFTLTGAQTTAIDEITSDMAKNVPMNRLLQGDVGSGKTVVAAAACYFSYLNHCQSALMAPTEILASQHMLTLQKFLEPLGVKVCLLKGSMTPKQKSQRKKEIADGQWDVVVGTHALVQQSTTFQSLGLVITDEQHRFGVNQRAALAEKGKNPHKLVMSATPIPRTLGLIVYGDLDISILNELPKGRKPIQTYAVTGKLRERAYGFVRKELDAGRQGYIVCPAIEESENGGDLIAVKTYIAQLKKGPFANYSLALLHGKMPPAEKDGIMEQFKAGQIQLLVSTTVVEVGVDVPNATVMFIENADRYGLSQLHQLRGRVGRGSHQSACILVTDNPTEEVRERLHILSSTTDGFQIAEADLQLRGCGDFFGQRQHGLPPLHFAELSGELLQETQKAAKEFLSKDPALENSPALRQEVERLFEIDPSTALN